MSEKWVDWVGVVFIKDHKVLVLKEFKKDFLMLPGGKMENGETREETAVREVKEELGFKPSNLKWFGEFSGKGKTTNRKTRFCLFYSEELTHFDKSSLPKTTEFVRLIDSSYESLGYDVGALLKNFAIDELLARGLIY